jgi:hypothetical protein
LLIVRLRHRVACVPSRALPLRAARTHPRRGRAGRRVPLPQPDPRGRTLALAVSQSGETADTLAALREAKQKGALVAGICNVVGSTIARETGRGVYLHAGPEISVAEHQGLHLRRSPSSS